MVQNWCHIIKRLKPTNKCVFLFAETTGRLPKQAAEDGNVPKILRHRKLTLDSRVQALMELTLSYL